MQMHVRTLQTKSRVRVLLTQCVGCIGYHLCLQVEKPLQVGTCWVVDCKCDNVLEDLVNLQGNTHCKVMKQ
jgi:hypothetical protein